MPRQHAPIFFRPSIELNLEGWIIIIIIIIIIMMMLMMMIIIIIVIVIIIVIIIIIINDNNELQRGYWISNKNNYLCMKFLSCPA